VFCDLVAPTALASAWIAGPLQRLLIREAGESLARRLDAELELPSSGGVDAFPLESRRHADVGHDHLGAAASAPRISSS
jgi:hypothetical protein